MKAGRPAKTEENKKIMYMRDELHMSFAEISVALTLAGRKLTESVAARIYNREKAKTQEVQV